MAHAPLRIGLWQGKLRSVFQNTALMLSMHAERHGCEVVPMFAPGPCDIFMLWGGGDAGQASAAKRAREAGAKHVGYWDFGYWRRTGIGPWDTMFRFSIDHLHPHKYVYAMKFPGDRWAKTHEERMRESCDPKGHVLVCGLGPKSREQFGYAPGQWEMAAVERARALYPGRVVYYRPKPGDDEPLPGTVFAGNGTIQNVLGNCALVICRHSNVAIDACIAGVPVLCEDGAGFALYNNDTIVRPTLEERQRLLNGVAYTQWSGYDMESGEFFTSLKEILSWLG